jgi:antitoxin PrlF
MRLHYASNAFALAKEELMSGMLTSKVTERSQTTLPAGVRAALGIGPGERLGYVIEGNEVRLVNASALEHQDPVLDGFLSFIAGDIARHPDHVAPFPPALLERAKALTAGIEIDHDEPIEGVTAF